MLHAIRAAIRLTIFISLVLCSSRLIAAPEQQKNVNDNAPQSVLKIGLPYFSLPPYIYIDDSIDSALISPQGYAVNNGAYSGLFIDVLKQVSAHAELNFQLVFYPTYEDVTTAFKAGELDLLLGVSSTFERQKFMAFSEPIFSIRRGVITQGKPINRYQELNDKAIAVEQGFALHELLPALLPKVQLHSVPNSTAAIKSIENNTSFGYIGDAAVLSNLLKQNNNQDLSLSILPGLPTNHLHFATQKGKHKLLSRINFALEDIKRDSMKAIYNQWLTPDQQNMFTHYGQLRLTAEERNWLDANPSITVGIHRDWAPYDYINPQNRHTGLSADILNIVSYELGVKFKIESSPSYSALRESFAAGNIMMLSSVAETPEDSQQMYFSSPYIQEPWVLFGRTSGTFNDIFQKTKTRVGVINNTAGDMLLPRVCENCEPVSFINQVSAFQALQKEEIDQVLTSLHHASPLLQSDYIGQFKMIGQIQQENLLPLRFAVNYRHPILLNIINKALAAIPEEEFYRIEHQWLTFDYQEGLAPMAVAKWAGLISALGLIIIISVISWNRKMAQEILQRKTAERRAKRAEQRLQQLADNLDGIVLQHVQSSISDPLTFHFTFVSAGITELLNISAEQLFNTPTALLDQMKINDLSTLKHSMLSACQEGHWDHEQAMKSHNGQPMWVQFKSRITPHEDNGYYWNTVVTDISLLKQQQQALDDARQKAEIATAAKSQFLATISHEVRTPISGIMGLLELMSDQPLNEETRSLHGGLTQSARNMLHIVNDVLDFSKIEAGKLELNPTTVQLGTTLARIIQPQSIHAQQKSLAFHYWQDPLLAHSHFVDDIRLHQILNNFLNNAIKFTQQGTISLIVDVLTQQQKIPHQSDTHTIQVVRFSVKDTGIGISQQQQEALFKPFEQADQSTSRRFGGTGLGLAIARKLVEQMDGTITVSSEEGKGSTFAVTLPLTVTSQQSSLRQQVRLNEKSALLFGYFIQREELYQYLRHHDMTPELSTAVNPQAISDILKRQQPDFAFFAQSIWQQLKQKTPDFLNDLANCKVVIINQNPMLSPEPLDNQWWISVNPLLPDNLFHVMTQPIKEATAIAKASTFSPILTETKEEAESNGRLILVAEDHPINQQVIAKQLVKIGVHADIVSNGLEALAALKEKRYGLLLSDCHMPEMDGYTLATTIRQHHQTGEATNDTLSNLPIIALTANAIQGEDNRCYAVGMNDFLIKPVSITKLRQVINKWLPEPAEDTEEITKVSTANDFGALFGDISMMLETPESDPLFKNEQIDNANHDQATTVDAINSVLERDKVMSIFDDEELTDSLIDEFKINHQQDLELLQQALSTNNQKSAADVAHRMKGAARMLECEILAAPLEQIEYQANHNQLTPTAEAVILLQTLSKQL
ncbi:transporter substrate-binding domain-containing protein [Photobacterium makurazakiensis]|uniref:transporter substrate-binding domain-containing protein n=1 Tax=Photobacterium makurazakiensis TaxID=2910234 RepID=UPI003D12B27A